MSNHVKRCPWCRKEVPKGMLYCNVEHYKWQRMFYFANKDYQKRMGLILLDK